MMATKRFNSTANAPFRSSSVKCLTFDFFCGRPTGGLTAIAEPLMFNAETPKLEDVDAKDDDDEFADSFDDVDVITADEPTRYDDVDLRFSPRTTVSALSFCEKYIKIEPQ